MFISEIVSKLEEHYDEPTSRSRPFDCDLDISFAGISIVRYVTLLLKVEAKRKRGKRTIYASVKPRLLVNFRFNIVLIY